MAILAGMKTATVTDAKNGLSALLDRVRAGESVVITDRGVPVAVLEPVAGRVDVEDRLLRLERAGLLRRGTGKPPIELMRAEGPPVQGGFDAVAALLEERRSGW
jgi:prevent-host-death family protein